MSDLNFSHIFKNAFDTFKVFETISFDFFGLIINGHSTSIWQILNHLVIWQEFQLKQLNSTSSNHFFDETASWVANSSPANKKQWLAKINEFNIQITTLKSIAYSLSIADDNLNDQLKIIQESSTHLSFHIGEIILIARQKNQYPQPSEMTLFLKN